MVEEELQYQTATVAKKIIPIGIASFLLIYYLSVLLIFTAGFTEARQQLNKALLKK